ncbi:hypothetical protein MKC91_09965 [[Clostridium] innocuum]|nr:hypothetical protein [[Clostridium] innocuum]MCR0534604.1 hypothetical protein [[Clostridium] innocuum]MCR0538726.1 hypothetical protein [[Clostridium] innocuum]
MRRKRQLRKEREIRKFCKDTANEELLFRFMKAYSMNESMALKTLNEYHIEITRQQIAYARKKKKEIQASNKRKRMLKKERKQRLLQEREYQEYKADVCLRFIETGQIDTLEESAIIREEFF